MAEFIKVAKDYKRMCASFDECENCPLDKVRNRSYLCRYSLVNEPEKAESVIVKWASEHPVKTNAQKFEEVFGFDFSDKFIIPGNASKWLEEEYKEDQNG